MSNIFLMEQFWRSISWEQFYKFYFEKATLNVISEGAILKMLLEYFENKENEKNLPENPFTRNKNVQNFDTYQYQSRIID